MGTLFRHILIIADIEGSSRCWSYSASRFMTDLWSRACVGMTKDVNAVVRASFDAGVKQVTVKDFHRTGYNLLPEGIDPRARIVQGYQQGPVPGLGDPGDAQAVMFLGMHAASGTGGFLAHTLTSRIRRLEVNGKPLAEVQLFSAALSGYGIRPVFFSGCPVACDQAARAISGIATCPIDKASGPGDFNAGRWRRDLAAVAVSSLDSGRTKPYRPSGPFAVRATFRNGDQAARQIARRWGLDRAGADILFNAADIHKVYDTLIRICYLTPLIEKMIPLALPLFNARGLVGLYWVRRNIKKNRFRL